MRDLIGKPIWPNQVDRVLGEKFFSATQLAVTTGTSLEQMDKMLAYLEETNYLRSWLAPQCASCEYVWPHCHASEQEEDLLVESEVECPICNHTFNPFIVYQVFQIIREFPTK